MLREISFKLLSFDKAVLCDDTDLHAKLLKGNALNCNFVYCIAICIGQCRFVNGEMESIKMKNPNSGQTLSIPHLVCVLGIEILEVHGTPLVGQWYMSLKQGMVQSPWVTLPSNHLSSEFHL